MQKVKTCNCGDTCIFSKYKKIKYCGSKKCLTNLKNMFENLKELRSKYETYKLKQKHMDRIKIFLKNPKTYKANKLN